jgi:hypothetical protein
MTKKILALAIIGIFVLTTAVKAEKVASLTDFLRPHKLVIDNDQMYVTEGANIYVYSLKDYKLKKKFGKDGEGPQEFKLRRGHSVWLSVEKDQLLIGSVAKVSFFSKDGTFKKEVSAPYGRYYQEIGKDTYIGRGLIRDDNKNYTTINFFDAQFKPGKEICRHLVAQQSGRFAMWLTPFLNHVYDNKVFVAGHEDMIIDVYDQTGKKLYEIKTDYDRVKVTEDQKERKKDFYKKDPRRSPEQVQRILKGIWFPTHFPAISDFHVDDNKVYVKTFREKNGTYEFYIFDIKGKLLKKVFVPMAMRFVVVVYPYTVNGGKLYQLVENDDSEEWDLHVLDIK